MYVLLDSTVLIDALRGRPAADRIRRLREIEDVPCTTAINVEEIVRGLKPKEHAVARRLFDGLIVLPIREEEAWRAGEWRRSYAAKGFSISQADALIGAVATSIHARLATGNPKDFAFLAETVEHWPVGR